MQALTLVRVHEPDAVREIVREAVTIADETDTHGDAWETIFGKVVDLLAARIPIVPQAPIPFDLDSLRGPRI